MFRAAPLSLRIYTIFAVAGYTALSIRGYEAGTFSATYLFALFLQLGIALVWFYFLFARVKIIWTLTLVFLVLSVLKTLTLTATLVALSPTADELPVAVDAIGVTVVLGLMVNLLGIYAVGSKGNRAWLRAKSEPEDSPAAQPSSDS